MAANLSTRARGWPTESPRQKPQPFCKLISKVTSYHFFQILFIRSQWLGPTHTQGEAIIWGHWHQEEESWEVSQGLPTTGCYAETVCFSPSPLAPCKSSSYLAESSLNEPKSRRSRSMWLTSLCSWNEKETTASLSLSYQHFVTIQVRTWGWWWQWERAQPLLPSQTPIILECAPPELDMASQTAPWTLQGIPQEAQSASPPL